MADSKVSDLTSATTVAGSDILYLVQAGTSKKVTINNLYNNAANINLNGIVKITGSEVVNAGSDIGLSKPITKLEGGSILSGVGIANGVEGQLKIITFNQRTSGSFQLNTGNIAGNVRINFLRLGDTAMLIFIDNKWHLLGGTANVIYP